MPVAPWSHRALLVAYVLYAALACTLLARGMPPFMNADEQNHFLRAVQISAGGIVGQRMDEGRNSGGTIDPGPVNAAAPFEPLRFHPERRATRAMFEEARTVRWGADPTRIGFANTAIYPPFFYVPAVAAIWLGRALNLPVVTTLYAVRAANALASLLLIALALRTLLRCGRPGGALLMFGLVTLPMALSLQNACSQDGLMLGLAATAAALFVRQQTRAGRADFALMCACLALLAMARPPYIGLALIPLAAAVPARQRVLGAVLTALPCLAWAAFAAAFISIDTAASRGGNVGQQLRLMLHPSWDISLATRTLDAHGREYLQGFTGLLGWLDLLLPWSYTVSALLLLALVAAWSARWTFARQAPGRTALIWAAVLASALGVFVIQYLTWTPFADPVIDGVQGRYFLPLALMLTALPLGPGYQSGLAHRAVTAIVVLFPALSLGVTMHALILRYYWP